MGASRTRHEKGNFPVDTTTFIGRRQEIADIKRLLSGGRLVTLTGIGGVGKTRLALQVARDLRRAFPDGVWLVKLADLTDGALVVHTVADVLSAKDQAGSLSDFLRDQRLLVVLDNCEHLIDDCARLVDEVLRAAPCVRFLATSRELLGVPGERAWPVPPLSLPTGEEPLPPGADTQYAALALFADRAETAVPGFAITDANIQTVARICARLEGLPLAIELATARLRALSLDDVLDRLEDQLRLLTSGARTGEPRHQTLRAAMDWSFELCTAEERALWERASVFAGSFDLPAAEAIYGGDDIERENVVELLATLVDKSVLTCDATGGQTRYCMLETLRQYGREQLRETMLESVIRSRHRDWYTSVARQAELTWFGPNQVELFERMKRDRPNLRAAMEYCLEESDHTATALYLAASLWFYWMPGGFLPEGHHWLGRVLTADSTPSRERAKALWVNAWLVVLQGDVDAAKSLLEEARMLAQQLDDESALAHALHVTGHLALLSDDLPVATIFLEEALARFRAMDELTVVTIMSRVHLATAHIFQGDHERAVALCEESRALCESRGEQWALSSVLYALAHTEWARGESRKATEHARASLRIKRRFDDLIGIALAVEILAWTAAAEGEGQRAARLLGGTHSLWQSIGSLPLFGFKRLTVARDEVMDEVVHQLGAERFDAAFEAGRGLGTEPLVDFALGQTPEMPVMRESEAAAGTGAVLTRREREVAELVADGLSNKEIAAQLVISQRTAEAHVEHALAKLGFTSRTQIAALISKERDSGEIRS